jgi:tRNA-2-methylthio-N6-dimethylallyladenosine synthase
MNRVSIKTYGCQMNLRDSEAIGAMLVNRGYRLVSKEESADIILLNTCSIREQAELKAIGKARFMVNRKKKGKTQLVGIVGCMAQNRGQTLLDTLPDLDLIIGTQKFHTIPDHLDTLIKKRQQPSIDPETQIDLGEEAGSQNTIRPHLNSEKKPSAFVSIMQGCNMQCAYCIVPQTRGKERARPIEDIVDEVQELAENGTKEITLLGQIVTSYGRREIPFKNGKSPFVQLIEAIHEIEKIHRIRFTSPHPRGFKQDLIEAYRDLPKVCKYAHLPIQSGSDTILKAMNRPYTVNSYLKIIHALKNAAPLMHFSTDIIVGFPGETDEDFQATHQVFTEVEFDMAFIFKYSPRPGSPAEHLGDPIPKETKEHRNQSLLKLLEGYSLKRNQSLVGTHQTVLVESKAKRGESQFMGRTDGYRKVIFPGNPRLIGEMLSIEIEKASVNSLFGSPLLTGLSSTT